MPLTDAGRNFMVQSTIAAAATPFNNANSYIGVGDSTTAFAVGQTKQALLEDGVLAIPQGQSKAKLLLII